MSSWFGVRTVDGLIELDVMPYQPGGCTIRVTPEAAADLARRLIEAIKEVKK